MFNCLTLSSITIKIQLQQKSIYLGITSLPEGVGDGED
jgi:hypothetical protein